MAEYTAYTFDDTSKPEPSFRKKPQRKPKRTAKRPNNPDRGSKR